MESGAPPRDVGLPLIREAARDGRSTLLETEARGLLEEFGVPLVQARLCVCEAEVAEAFGAFGPSVVLKAVSGTITHKTEAGGVRLDVQSVDDALRTYREIRRSISGYARRSGVKPDFRGVLVSPMLSPPRVELLAGVRSDRTFGLVLTLGAGGVDVEVLRDVSVRILPIAPEDVEEMVDELRIAPLLRGHRGRPGADLASLKRLLVGLARCALAHPEVVELELNPVFAGPDGAQGVDARGFLASREVAVPRADSAPPESAEAVVAVAPTAAPGPRGSATPVNAPESGSR
jgi:succinyl-CoA synthetase beta subunit